MRAWQVTSALLENAADLTLPVVKTIEADGELEQMGDRFSLNPFPGSTMPLASPENWPPNRSVPITLPTTVNQIDLTKINLPDGWKLLGQPSWKRENEVGEISFRVVQEGNKVTVRRDVLIKKDSLPADKEREVRFLLAWMEEVAHQTLAFSTQ